MRRAVRIALLTVAITVVAPLASAADEGAERDAQARFEEGLARAKTGDFDAARISFTQAYAVLRRPRILWNLALTEEKTGHTLDALGHFKSVARDPSAEDSDRAGAQTHVATLYGQTGHIEVRAPAGAPVTIDSGPVVGMTPLADVLDVAPGRHVVEVRLAQGPLAVVVEPEAGQVLPASFLPPPPVATPAPPASPSPAPAPIVPPSRPSSVHKPSDAPRIITVVALGGAAVVTAVLGVYFGVTSTNDANTAKGLRTEVGSGGCVAPAGEVSITCSQLSDAVNSENRNAGLSTGMYVTAGVLAAAGIVTWLVWPHGDAGRDALRVSPVLGPGVAGLSAGMAF
jgi:hypothetical protein